MDQEREHERLTYQLCRLGFAILSFALVVACFTTLITLPQQFNRPPFFRWMLHTTFGHWLDAPVVWGSLVGTYLLWGRWSDPGWQRRTGLLLLMCLVDLLLWFLSHGDSLGLRVGDVGHPWLREHLGQALGWAEFTLIASLACDVMIHLGVPQAGETGKSTRSLAATGAAVWMVLFLLRTDWRHWPLDFRRVFSIDMLLLDLGSTMIWTITLIQVTALSIAATRQTSAVLAEFAREDEQADLFSSPSDADFGLMTAGGAFSEE